MKNKIELLSRWYCLFGILLTLSGCNTGEDQIPPEATVEITPELRTWEIQPLGESGCVIVDLYQDNIFTIRVLDTEDRPIPNAEIFVHLTHTENTLHPFSIVELYEDKDGDLIPSEDEYVSAEDDPILITRTDKYNGYKTLIVRTNLSCPYSAILSVVAGGAANEASIVVSEE